MTRFPTVPLGEVCSFLNGGTPSKSVPEYFNGDIPWITGADITSSVVTHARSFITEDAIEKSATNYVPAGTVLLVTRTSVGKVATAGVPLCFSQDITALTPDLERVDTNYLVHFLRTKQSYFEASARGATIQGITRQVVANLDFPDCAPREQKRIAAILDKADAIRRKRQHALRLTDDFLRSVFLDMFGDPRFNPKGLPRITLGDLIKLKSGDALVAKDMATGGSFPVYGGNGINGYHNEFMFEERKIVLGRVGAYCGAVHYTLPRSWITDNALYVEHMKRPMEPIYLVDALRFANLNQYAGQAGQPLISGGRIYPIEIIAPTPTEQTVYATIVTKAQATREALTNALYESDDLFSSLQQRAFSGEL